MRVPPKAGIFYDALQNGNERHRTSPFDASIETFEHKVTPSAWLRFKVSAANGNRPNARLTQSQPQELR
jgi:hypothetical protein